MDQQERIYAGNVHINDAINVDNDGRPFPINHLGIYIQTCEKTIGRSIRKYVSKLNPVNYNTYDILNKIMNTKDTNSTPISKFINNILMNALNYSHAIIIQNGSPVEHVVISIDPLKKRSNPIIIDFLIELMTQCYYLASSEMMYAIRQLAYYISLFFHNLLLRIPEDRINDILVRLHEICPRENKIAMESIKDMHDGLNKKVLLIISRKMQLLINIINKAYSDELASRDIIKMQRRIKRIIASIKNKTDMNITINAFEELLSIMENIKRDYIGVDPKKITILVPSCHVNAPVGRNISFNYIRKNALLFKDYIWMGSDDDDTIKIKSMSAIKKEIIRQSYDISNIILTQSNQTIQNKKEEKVGITRYAAWSYLFSPIYYNNISYRCAPMNKEDLDFFNRLITTGNYVHLSNKNIAPYEYSGASNDDTNYERYIPFHDSSIIEYMNDHNKSEHDLYHESKNPPHIAPSMSTSTIMNKYFYINDASEYIVDTASLNASIDNTRHVFGLKFRDNDPEDPSPREEFFNYRQYDPNTNENLNGDCYMITYKAIAIDETSENVTYNIMFQNGKTFVPESIVARLNEVALRNNIDEHTINAIISLLQTESADSISEDILTYMRHWNNELLKDTEERSIPMLMYGSSIKNTPQLMILLIILLALMAIIVIVILTCTIRNYMSKTISVIPLK